MFLFNVKDRVVFHSLHYCHLFPFIHVLIIVWLLFSAFLSLPLLVSFSVMNNYQAAAAAAHSFAAPSASPHTTTTRQGFPSTNSPVPAIDMYSSTAADNVGYVQATSPQPSGFPIAVSRAPLNYSPVSSHGMKSLWFFYFRSFVPTPPTLPPSILRYFKSLRESFTFTLQHFFALTN